MTRSIGWETVQAHLRSRNELSSALDTLVAFAHYQLAFSEPGLGAVGSGDNFSNATNDPSEILPQGWNAEHAVMYRQFEKPTNKFQLKALMTNPGIWLLMTAETTVLVNVVRIADEKVATMTVNLAESVEAEEQGKFRIKDEKALSEQIRTEILDEFFPKETDENKRKKSEKSSVETSEQKPSMSQQSNPRRVTDPLGVGPVRGGYGRSDLDPLGRGTGGGMLFEPPGMGGRGGGRLEPRFDDPYGSGIPDPFGGRADPMGRGRGRGRGGRGPGWGDEFPPPDFDNMFG